MVVAWSRVWVRVQRRRNTLFDLSQAKSHAHTETHTHTHTHSHTHTYTTQHTCHLSFLTLALSHTQHSTHATVFSSLSFSLSLSHTHTHTYTHCNSLTILSNLTIWGARNSQFIPTEHLLNPHK